MSSHHHLILKAVPEEAEEWSDKDVIKRWLSLFRGSSAAKKCVQGEVLKFNEQEAVNALAPIWRNRLTDISWFMKCLNEPIARSANKEDNIGGNFWISRFRSEALLDEEAILTAMAYVDLNPIRAGIANTPESSEHTSIKERIDPQFSLSEAIKSYCEQGGFSVHLCCDDNTIRIRELAAFNGDEVHDVLTSGISFNQKDYFELVDHSGRVIGADKTGHIDDNLPPILDRLEISRKTWFENCQNFEAIYSERFAPKLLFSD